MPYNNMTSAGCILYSSISTLSNSGTANANASSTALSSNTIRQGHGQGQGQGQGQGVEGQGANAHLNSKNLLEYSTSNIYAQQAFGISANITANYSRAGVRQMSYVYDGFYWHYLIEELAPSGPGDGGNGGRPLVDSNNKPVGYLFLCLTDQEFPRRRAFAFLNKLKTSFFERVMGVSGTTSSPTFSASNKPIPSSSSSLSSSADPQALLSFHPYLQSLVKEFAETDAMNAVQSEVNEVRIIMGKNIEKVLERGERIESLVESTDNLSQQSLRFRQGARQVKQRMWFENQRLWLGLGAGALLLTVIIVLVCVL